LAEPVLKSSTICGFETEDNGLRDAARRTCSIDETVVIIPVDAADSSRRLRRNQMTLTSITEYP
jgi:hypothetical protein